MGIDSAGRLLLVAVSISMQRKVLLHTEGLCHMDG